MKPVTLGFLLDHAHGLRATCQDCARSRPLPVTLIAGRLGRECEVPELRRRLRCSACGSAKIVCSVESEPTEPTQSDARSVPRDR